MKSFPSIFNDVIGPVMRGPSSSHCAAALRIGRIVRALMKNDITEVHIKFDNGGSLATTHKSQGSDMGLLSGLLGFETVDEELLNYEKNFAASGIKLTVEYADLNYPHPNTYNIFLRNGRTSHSIIALSTGGGIIEVTEIDGAPVSIAGDFYETLLFADKNAEELAHKLSEELHPDFISVNRGEKCFIEIKTSAPVSIEKIEMNWSDSDIIEAVQIDPVLPVLSSNPVIVPFTSAAGLIDYNKEKHLELWELAIEYESMRGNMPKEEVFGRMKEIVKIMTGSIENGLRGTEYSDRILPSQSPGFHRLMEEGKLLGDGLTNLITLYTTAIMETKSSMGVIVAAPTAGSCGSVAGPVIAAAHFLKLREDTLVKGMLIAGLIGVFIAHRSTFAAEEAGCQAECGSGSGMAAAALAFFSGGTLNQSLAAASLALQNTFGMTCDPVAARVEAPCLGKNVMAGVNALACANMALAGFMHLIPLDEVIEAFDKTGRSLPRELRCTAMGGLSVTGASKKIEDELGRKG